MLFFDPRLSNSQVMSCATCHNPSFAWGDSLPKGVGHGHKQLGRRTPTILNSAFNEVQFWDGRAHSLEEQAIGPIVAAGEMNFSIDQAVENISAIPEYVSWFNEAYPGEEICEETIGKAIASFERTVISGEAPFDRWINGDADAISKKAKWGFKLFNEKANCVNCHSGWNFTDSSFHDIGVKTEDKGRGGVLEIDALNHAFKTPTLRNIVERAPYMHNGSEATLHEVLVLYNLGGRVHRPTLSDEIEPLGLNEDEIDAVIEFLKTLSSKDDPVELPILPR